MDSTDESRWAGPDTLLGLLQRGRGAGYQRSLIQRDDAPGAVVECIVHDPRLDPQVERRGWFSAALVAELQIDLSVLRPAYSDAAPPGPDTFGWDTAAWLVTDVFAFAAQRGIPGGVTELRRYLRSGRDVELALDHLLPLAAGHPEADGLLDDVLEVAAVEHLRGAFSWYSGDFTAEPWSTWRRSSAEIDDVIRAILAERATRHPAPMKERKHQFDVARRELLVRTGREAVPGTAQARLAELADGSGEDALLDVACVLLEDPDLDRKVKTALRRTLSELRSPKALSWARATASLADAGGHVALKLLADQAPESDLPQLRALLDEAVTRGFGEIYAQCSLVDGIGRLGDRASLGVIESLFDETVYSYLRTRCAKVLSTIDASTFARVGAVECLYDCDEEAREIAIGAVDTGLPGVRERLMQMAADPTEEDSCRDAATRTDDA